MEEEVTFLEKLWSVLIRKHKLASKAALVAGLLIALLVAVVFMICFNAWIQLDQDSSTVHVAYSTEYENEREADPSPVNVPSASRADIKQVLEDRSTGHFFNWVCKDIPQSGGYSILLPTDSELAVEDESIDLGGLDLSTAVYVPEKNKIDDIMTSGDVSSFPYFVFSMNFGDLGSSSSIELIQQLGGTISTEYYYAGRAVYLFYVDEDWRQWYLTQDGNNYFIATMASLGGNRVDMIPYVMASIAKGSCLDDVASVTSKTRLGTQDPGYTIVVTNQIGREVALDGTYDRVVEMIGMYEPWITYAPYVEVKKVLNTEYDFNCYVRSTLSDGRKLTDCDQKLVYKTVKEQMGEKEADAVVLTVADGKASSEQSNVIITGEGVSAGVLAHEFGHLTGDLRDEYVYSEGDVQGGRIKVYDPQPNCFASKEDCDAVMSKYRYTDTDYCMRGCQTNDYWRPTSRGIMSTSRGASSYGGFETCLMAQAMEEQIIVRVPNFEPSRSFCARGY